MTCVFFNGVLWPMELGNARWAPGHGLLTAIHIGATMWAGARNDNGFPGDAA